MDMWQNAVLGGILIGCSAALLYVFMGKISGISGIFYHFMLPVKVGVAERQWRGIFLLGLFLGGWLAVATGFSLPSAPLPEQPIELFLLILSGFLVGFGTRLGSGCTSGHGVCGVARWSPRSLLATALFMLMGMLTATFFKPILMQVAA